MCRWQVTGINDNEYHVSPALHRVISVPERSSSRIQGPKNDRAPATQGRKNWSVRFFYPSGRHGCPPDASCTTFSVYVNPFKELFPFVASENPPDGSSRKACAKVWRKFFPAKCFENYFPKNSKVVHSLDANQLNNAENASAINQEPSKQEKKQKESKRQETSRQTQIRKQGKFLFTHSKQQLSINRQSCKSKPSKPVHPASRQLSDDL